MATHYGDGKFLRGHHIGWQCSVAVTRWSRSTQLLYIETGYYWDGRCLRVVNCLIT